MQVLSASQERALWEEVLQKLADDDFSLAAHTHALMRAAGRAAQSQLTLSRSAGNDEERLLATTLAEVQQLCQSRGFIALRLATPAMLGFLADVPAPLLVGQAHLTELQRSLQQQCWQGTPLLAASAQALATPALRRAADPDAELAACASWCLQHLRREPAARLLVLSAAIEPALAIQGDLLWRELAGAQRDDAQLRRRMLAVEGGEPLQHQGLIDEVFAALACAEAEIDTECLFTLLRSAYFDFGPQADRWLLQGWFEQRGIARFTRELLRDAFNALVDNKSIVAAAARFTTWFAQLGLQLDQRIRSTADWAQRFHDSLAAGGFGVASALDSGDQQRLARWSELLDEFAALDAVLPPIGMAEALQRLRRLAAEGRHQPASGDAAITLSDQLADPVIDYDGIWVLGLAETRWPVPPRPDPYVSLIEQRRSQWPESGVSQRRAQALWAQSRWQQRTPELVLSYAARDGDLHHRPSALPGVPLDSWIEVAHEPAAVAIGLSAAAEDQQFHRSPTRCSPNRWLVASTGCASSTNVPSARRRSGASRPCHHSHSPTASRRRCVAGCCIHCCRSCGESCNTRPRCCTDARSAARIAAKLLGAGADEPTRCRVRWLPPRLLQRERARSLRVVERLLELERQRPPFTVQDRERALEWPATGARLRLRIDRIDRNAAGQRILIDYKSGAPDGVKLHEGELEPLQLALYVAALAVAEKRCPQHCCSASNPTTSVAAESPPTRRSRNLASRQSKIGMGLQRCGVKTAATPACPSQRRRAARPSRAMPVATATCRPCAAARRRMKTWRPAMSDAAARAAALDIDRQILLQAPAGSGKTTVLAQRFLAALAASNEPEEVLAVTFTRKAAAEMRERVVLALEDALPPTRADRADWSPLREAVLAQAAARGWSLEELPQRLRIQTIDSLCAEIARSMPLLGRMQTSLAVVDDATPLYREAARDTLREAEADRIRAPTSTCCCRDSTTTSTSAGLLANLLASRNRWQPWLLEHPQQALGERVASSLRRIVADTLQRAHRLFPVSGRAMPRASRCARLRTARTPCMKTMVRGMPGSRRMPHSTRTPRPCVAGRRSRICCSPLRMKPARP